MTINAIPCAKLKRGFTLIELLVVIAIIGVLVSLLLPAVQYAREAANRARCKNNMKQIGLALIMFHDVNESFPAGYLAEGVEETDPASAETGPGFAWGLQILPYLEHMSLYEHFDLRESATDQHNLEHGEEELSVFQCPSDDDIGSFYVSDSSETYHLPTSNYVGVYGYGSLTMSPGKPEVPGILYRNSAVHIRDITDGTSRTMIVGERTGRHRFEKGAAEVSAHATWYAAIPGVTRPAGMSMMPMMQEGPGTLVLGHVGQSMPMTMHHTPSTTNHISNFSSKHNRGMHFVMADGSVHYISNSIDYDIFRRLGQRGDSLPLNDF